MAKLKTIESKIWKFIVFFLILFSCKPLESRWFSTIKYRKPSKAKKKASKAQKGQKTKRDWPRTKYHYAGRGRFGLCCSTCISKPEYHYFCWEIIRMEGWRELCGCRVLWNLYKTWITNRDCLVWLQFASDNGFESSEVGQMWKGTW